MIVDEVKNVLISRNYDENTINAILNFFREKGIGTWIKGADLARVSSLSIDEIYKMYFALCEIHFLEPRYTALCPVCEDIIGEYHSITDIPSELLCKRCGFKTKISFEAVTVSFEIMNYV